MNEVRNTLCQATSPGPHTSQQAAAPPAQHGYNQASDQKGDHTTRTPTALLRILLVRQHGCNLVECSSYIISQIEWLPLLLRDVGVELHELHRLDEQANQQRHPEYNCTENA